MKAARTRTLAVLALCWLTLPALAQSPAVDPTPVAGSLVPSLIRFSGAITDIQGKPLSGMAGVTFAIYQNQSGGAPLWLETQNVAIDGNGRYTVNLGANHAGGIPAELFAAGEARWLGVQPEAQAEQPRVLLVSVPYAMKAADADTLGGLPASSYVTMDQFSVGSRQSPVPASDNGNAAGAQVTPSPCNAVASDGMALANYLTKFTAPCNVENSGIYQSALATTPGFIGVGTTAPVAPLDMEPAAQTGTSGGLFGVHVIANFNPTGNSTGNYYAFYGQSNSSTGNTTNFTGDIVGSGFIAQHYGTGTVSNLFGANYSVQNRAGGTVTNAVGFYGGVSNLGAGTIANGYGVQVPVPQNSGGGTFTNFYGVYIANPTGITNSWGLYSLANTNYMSGKLGINVMAPTQALEINGNLKFDTTGHGITYADGTVQTTASIPGSGTITKVTAGTDLTGGGSSGAVTLNLDTTKVPTLAAATNTFTGAIHAASFTGDGTNVTNVNATQLGSVAASGYPQLAAINDFTNFQTYLASETQYVLHVYNSDTTDSGGAGIVSYAENPNGTGVYGEADTSGSAKGVFGFSSGGSGVYGQYVAASATGSNSQAAVWGDTNQSGSIAVLGTADDGNAGSFFNNSSTGETLFVSNHASAGAIAMNAGGSFGSCRVDVSGDLSCDGSTITNAKTSDQRTLEMYAVQGTENRYEDYGSGQLVNGRAVVEFDPNFAEVANTSIDYQVFPVPNGDCKGLYVTNKTAGSFEVRELGGGRTNIAFDYRIVAKRRGMENIRMKDVTERERKQQLARAARHLASTGVKHGSPARPRPNNLMQQR